MGFWAEQGNYAPYIIQASRKYSIPNLNVPGTSEFSGLTLSLPRSIVPTAAFIIFGTQAVSYIMHDIWPPFSSDLRLHSPNFDFPLHSQLES